jgi:Phage integrase, N-terminal SAM-like domain
MHAFPKTQTYLNVNDTNRNTARRMVQITLPSCRSWVLGPGSCIRAGYKAATIRVYLGHVQRFADHHMRSPERMGRLEVAQYLIHMLDDRNATLANFRAARAALCALYGVALKRPEEIETLPNRPEDLRQLAARVAAPPSSPAASATQPLPPTRDDAVLPSATVS